MRPRHHLSRSTRVESPLALVMIAVLAALLAMAGCATTSDRPFASVADPDADLADGSEDGETDETTPTSEPASDPECDSADARPSLRPDEGPLPRPGSMPSGTFMAEIADRGVLRVGVAQDTLLFGYLNPATGQIEGFDVEIARLVGDAIFGDSPSSEGRVEFIPITSAERIPKLADGSLDLVAKTMTINCERWGQINFSAVYYEAGQRVLVTEGSLGDEAATMSAEDLSVELVNSTLCAASGTTSLDNISEILEVDSVARDSWTDCLVAFQQGEVDGISTDDTILAGLAVQDPFAEVVGEFISEEPYGLGTPKDHPEFTRFVNQVLAQALLDGTWQRLYDEWLSETLGEAEIPSPSYR